LSATVTLLNRRKFANAYCNVANVTFDNSYPTGGESITAAQLGLTAIDFVQASPAGGFDFEWDYAASKLKAFKKAVGTIMATLSGGDVKGSANTDSENADAAAAPTNGTAVAAMAAVAEGAWTHGAITEPDRGRNVCITIQNDSGGPLNLYEGAMKFTVTGTWRGAAQTEDITITSTTENKAVANNKFRYKYGVKPFDTVTDITVDHVPADGLKIGAGLGSKIGLPNDLLKPAASDVKKITKNAANLATTGIVDTTNMTVNLGTLADNDDFEIVYQTTGEAASTADLSNVSTRLIAIGI
jgi:hypothetical protein